MENLGTSKLTVAPVAAPVAVENVVSLSKFGSSKKGNGALSTTGIPTKTPKKEAPNSSKKRNALTVFGQEAENDMHLTATLRSKKLDRELATLSIQKAKIDLLAQREAAEQERRREDNQIRIMQMKFQMQLRQQSLSTSSSNIPPAPPVLSPMAPFGDSTMGFVDENLFPMQTLLNAPFNPNLDTFDMNFTTNHPM